MSPRPPSIRIFGWLLLVATLVAIVSLPPAYALDHDTRSALLMLMKVAGYNLCFWYMIARRANMIALWLYVSLTLLSVPLLALSWDEFAKPGRAYLALVVVNLALELAAAGILFRRDAREWLRARGRLPDHEDIFG